ncbi:uncharacterized protein MELLADRAFT_69375 [Melampsora larici-populina 98AG31]|uniref:Uncharacterized protein n=1 Tax=Melampsora larici-populina (strain 98AG31 / pathotype 3-4-7) TaxID=747676 RepID=F4SAH3_MELLP|nr:uncharacterized protein MELLADRAFT_69375 [Melampsora larici-populina 98AG31]EGF98357.1 hypothetical protein MELLADRAFT_69375 [Melampsora larici-populina 98AG31]
MYSSYPISTLVQDRTINELDTMTTITQQGSQNTQLDKSSGFESNKTPINSNGFEEPSTGDKSKHTGWEQDIVSPNRRNPTGIYQQYCTEEKNDEVLLCQHQNNQYGPLERMLYQVPDSSSRSILDQMGQVEENFEYDTLIPLVLYKEMKNHIIHRTPDPNHYKGFEAKNLLYAAAHHGHLIINKHIDVFDEMNEFWETGSSLLLKVRKKWFPNFDSNIQSQFIWKSKNILFPILIFKVKLTCNLFGRLQKTKKLKNKGLVYQSACRYFKAWFSNLLDHYQNNWKKLLESNLSFNLYSHRTGLNPKNLLDVTSQLEFGTREVFLVKLSWEIFEGWLQLFHEEIHSCIFNTDTKHLMKNFKQIYGYSVKTSMMLEDGPYDKRQFNYANPDINSLRNFVSRFVSTKYIAPESRLYKNTLAANLKAERNKSS